MMRAWRARARAAVETLDDPRASDAEAAPSLRDLVVINRWFGPARTATARLSESWRGLPPGTTLTLLDVGTGLGDIPRCAARAAARAGVRLRLLGVEQLSGAARAAVGDGDLAMIRADGTALPLADRSVDLVLCAKLLHHLPGPRGELLLRELARVARRAVVVADLRRSAVGAAAIWLALSILRFHVSTRRDAVISVFRAFSARELAAACAGAGMPATVKRHPGWGLTATWHPGNPA